MQNQVLCKATLHAWLDEIPYDTLPQTIKDAIRVTQEIGLRYLWVDALCIVQDDYDGKLAQIESMARIYEEAYVTISAQRASSVQDGFLHPRLDPENALHAGFKLPFRCSSGELGSVTLVQLDPSNTVPPEPLSRRAWALQETLRSPRILEYRSAHLRWRCATGLDGPKYVDGWTSGTLSRWDAWFDWSEIDSVGSFEPRMWRDLIFEYSTRRLTYPDDKLRAISAVSRKIRERSGDVYVAGLWRSRLCEYLCWRTYFSVLDYSPGDSDTHNCGGGRASSYRAPSWSWASMNGAIDWSADGPTVLTFLDVHLETMPPNDPYGTILNAYLLVKGPCCRVGIIDDYVFIDRAEHTIPCRPWFDIHPSVMEVDLRKQKLLLLQVHDTVGLILTELSNKKFQRIGLFAIRSDAEASAEFSIGQRWQTETVTIV